MFANCLSVLACGITFVFFPAIMGIFLGKVVHVVVAKSLCQDAGSSDGKIFAVTLHYGGVGQATVGFEPVSVRVVRIGDGFVYAYLNDSSSAEQAESFRGNDLYVDRAHAAPMDEDAVYSTSFL